MAGHHPWSGREFKLPPASPGDTGGNEEEVAEHSEVERARPRQPPPTRISAERWVS